MGQLRIGKLLRRADQQAEYPLASPAADHAVSYININNYWLLSSHVMRITSAGLGLSIPFRCDGRRIHPLLVST